MTEKQKAKELIELYLLEVKGSDKYNYNLDSMNLFIAKNCARIAVNQIIFAISNFAQHLKHISSLEEATFEYWENVLTEIDRYEKSKQ